MNIEHVNNNEAQYDQRWSDEMSSVLPESQIPKKNWRNCTPSGIAGETLVPFSPQHSAVLFGFFFFYT